MTDTDSRAMANDNSRLEDLLEIALALLAKERGTSLDALRLAVRAPAVVRTSPDGPAIPSEAMTRSTDVTAPSLLSVREVSTKIGISVTKIYADMKRGTFPRPVKLGISSRWRLSDIEAWIDGLQIDTTRHDVRRRPGKPSPR